MSETISDSIFMGAFSAGFAISYASRAIPKLSSKSTQIGFATFFGILSIGHLMLAFKKNNETQ